MARAKRTASAKKQARAGARRTVRNRGVRSEVKTLIVKARKSLASSAADVLEVGVEAVRGLDRPAAKGKLHPDKAAGPQARLAGEAAKGAEAGPAAPGGAKDQ